ncbi:hypothetical protein BpHYR1_046551 [Brachionus plicatilis]|uniref:Uncharacterized protein n=1 Tax=Brachionus plicatilis TaxID=10195 RepID=A0A3M7RRZ0_BRAPC|nr:hypothetical protein BpHYR1_046551 [Brachionus plicatilis]
MGTCQDSRVKGTINNDVERLLKRLHQDSSSSSESPSSGVHRRPTITIAYFYIFSNIIFLEKILILELFINSVFKCVGVSYASGRCIKGIPVTCGPVCEEV